MDIDEKKVSIVKYVTSNPAKNSYVKFTEDWPITKFFGNVEYPYSLRFSLESVYSSTPHEHSKDILNVLNKSYDLANYTILNSTACIGADTYLFSKYFKHVHAVELDPINFSCLENNMKVLDLENVTCYNENALKIMSDLQNESNHADVLYLDPPWGGYDYKSQNSELKLSMDGKEYTISEILDGIDVKTLSIKPAITSYKMVILKLPTHHNVPSIYPYSHELFVCDKNARNVAVKSSSPGTVRKIGDNLDAYKMYKIVIMSKNKPLKKTPKVIYVGRSNWKSMYGIIT